MAQQSFDKVLRLNPDNLGVMVSYSQLLLMQGSDTNMTRAASMLSRVLKDEPTNVDAISLLALIAYERQDWAQAKSAFEVLLSTMDTQDSRYAMIAQRISDIEQKMAEQNNQIYPATSSENITNSTTSDEGITVDVNLDSALVDNLPENGTLFVFAKAAKGSPMPLAVVKLTDYSFPLKVQLSDLNSMVEGLTLSSSQEIVITARISKDASVMPSSGELEGSSPVLERAKVTQHTLLINELIP
ncbi:MAG: tetratricopeptide repeat protein, partial [Pseudoalteromonas sp.]